MKAAGRTIGKETICRKAVRKTIPTTKAKDSYLIEGTGTTSETVEKSSLRKRKLKRAERTRSTKQLNKMCNKGEIPATRMYYDSSESKYYVYNLGEVVKGGHPSCKTLVDIDELDQYNSILVESATSDPDTWVGPSIGVFDTGDAPAELCTQVQCLYQQLNKPYCLAFSFASALFYCGFRDEASAMYEAAEALAQLDFDRQLSTLLPFMQNLVPVIGQPTIYGVRTKRHDRKKRTLTWDDLFTDMTQYPTVVIPILPDGQCTHAFCVVDDLIFDSTTPKALQLRKESVSWLFRDRETTIHRAYRFNHRYSPPQTTPGKETKTRRRYRRKMKHNWTKRWE